MNNSISKDYNLASLLRFVFPTVVMMVFMSLYTLVDGVFVSRFIGTDALSAVNLVYPYVSLFIAIGVMFATGGSAVVARKMGEGDTQGARESLTLITIVGVCLSVVLAIIGMFFLEPLVKLAGAKGDLVPLCVDYLRVLLFFAPASVLQMLFQSFFVTEGKPMLGLAVTVLAGIMNGVLDYVFIVPLNMGIAGAALATAMGYMLPAIVGLIWFSNKKAHLGFRKPRWNWPVIIESCFNGSSEMVTNLSTAVTTFMFNLLMMRYLGSDGVAAITVVLYSQFLLIATFLGFSFGVAPIISYNYGSQNHQRLQKIFKICIGFIIIGSVVMFAAAMLLASPISQVFAKKGSNVYNIAVSGFYLFSTSFIFAGLNIFTSALFTALSNGRVSAIISFLRTFVFILGSVLILPGIIGVNGVWLAIPVAEAATAIVSVCYLVSGAKSYYYA